tara:strand:+ start:300 stop:491 length:192 start_codon:yes stop_codon:yes gene_type:complete
MADDTDKETKTIVITKRIEDISSQNIRNKNKIFLICLENKEVFLRRANKKKTTRPTKPMEINT